MPFSLVEIYSYISIVALLVMFPGPNTVLVMQSVGVSGRRAGFFNVLGIVTAVYCNALLSGLGLSVIIMQSAMIYNVMKLFGAGYIAYLGLTSLLDVYKLHKPEPAAAIQESSGDRQEDKLICESSFACYSRGVLTGILNPKSALFFLAFFPQFMHQDSSIVTQSIILTVLYSLVSATWYSLLVLFIGKLRHLLVRRNIQKRLKAVTGTLLVGIGIRMAVQR